VPFRNPAGFTGDFDLVLGSILVDTGFPSPLVVSEPQEGRQFLHDLVWILEEIRRAYDPNLRRWQMLEPALKLQMIERTSKVSALEMVEVKVERILESLKVLRITLSV
jgi:hypothetical protein